MPHFYVVGPYADSGDILMATVLNECKDSPGAPQTEFLLIIQSLDKSGRSRMMRVVGVTKQTMNSWNKRNEVPFLKTDPNVTELLRHYFSSRSERLNRYMAASTDEPPRLSKLIH
jgi:DNA-binding XRE family transcriptional regulator